MQKSQNPQKVFCFGENHAREVHWGGDKASVYAALNAMSNADLQSFIKGNNIKHAFFEFILDDDFNLNINSRSYFGSKGNGGSRLEVATQRANTYQKCKTFAQLADLFNGNKIEAMNGVQDIVINCIKGLRYGTFGNFGTEETHLHQDALATKLQQLGVKIYGIESLRAFTAVDGNGASVARCPILNEDGTKIIDAKLKQCDGNAFLVAGNAHFVDYDKTNGIQTLLKEKGYHCPTVLLSTKKDLIDSKFKYNDNNIDNIMPNVVEDHRCFHEQVKKFNATQKKERLIDRIMGNEALKKNIAPYVSHLPSRPRRTLTAEEEANSQSEQLKALEQLKPHANVLNAEICTKPGGASSGFTMVDNATKDTVYIKDDCTSHENNDALTFAFISKLLHKIDFGPRCEFLYDKPKNSLITLSAQLGHSKNKVFYEYKPGNKLLNPGYDKDMNTQQKAVDNAIQAIGSIGGHLKIGDLKGGDLDGNFGVTYNGTSYKPKIFDFTPYPIDRICGLWSTQRPGPSEREGYIKQYAKDWQKYDTLVTYMKRKFTETLNDKNIQELLEAMPIEQKDALDEYCKKIVELGIDELQVITSKPKEESKKGRPYLLQEQERNLSNLNFDNIGGNEYGQIGAPSKPKEINTTSEWNCFKSKNNKVGVER